MSALHKHTRRGRYWMGGLGGLMLLAAGVHLGLGSSACNEPIATSYGNPNGLDRKNLPGEGGVEALTCGGDAAPTGFDGGCPSFQTDIYPYFKPDGKWRCSDATCHGGASAPPIDGANANDCLASLRGITVGGKVYVPGDAGSSDPNASSLLCNLQGGCGSRMPKAPGVDPTSAELCIVEAWLKCGAPP
jgi:hypothetical protein